jgi:ABC-type antimicrobial peptide transport system permease subunit
MTFTPGQRPLQPDERWMRVAEGASDDVAAQLTAAPYTSNQVFNQEERETTLKSDPVALGTLGSLSLGFVAAAIFAGLGFAVSAAVSAHERLTEFALLRAIGLSSRQLVGWLSIEHGILVVISLIGGTVLGLLLSWVALPVISITQEARHAVPEVIVVYPWQEILLLEVGVVAMLLLSVGVLAVLLRRLGLGSLLRLGEE